MITYNNQLTLKHKMSRRRSSNSLMTKLEKMALGEEVFTELPHNVISVYLWRIKKKYPTRKYSKILLYTHKGIRYSSLKDFKQIACIVRLA